MLPSRPDSVRPCVTRSLRVQLAARERTEERIMKNTLSRAPFVLVLALAAGCGGGGGGSGGGSDGPGITVNPNPHETGDPVSGREVFRFETFGNEGFWTDAARLPQGVAANGVTPIDALGIGLNVDIEALDTATQDTIAAELLTDLSPANAPFLNDPNTTLVLLNANAIIGIVVKDTNGDALLDISNGDKAGATCALCHTITDASIFRAPLGGSIGRRLDGRTNHDLNFGALAALAENTRALYPMAQLALTANGGTTLGRAPTGLTETSSEAEFDAYFGNPAFYPIGMFDDTVDGNGDPMHTTPLFRTNLAAPWGSEGSISRLDNFSNLVYTALLDPTTLTTPGGRAFLNYLGGAAGDEIANDYVAVLAATGVTGYPYVIAELVPGTVPNEKALLGVRVDHDKLIDMNGYLDSLSAPRGIDASVAAIARGRALFRDNCTQCHNTAQDVFVPPFIVPMVEIWPGDAPVVLATRPKPLNDVLDSPGFFDDKMAVVNASIRGLPRGTALPLLLDLARKPVFLHDDSVESLDSLLDPTRGPTSPHPFYVSDPDQRLDLVDFLNSLDTN